MSEWQPIETAPRDGPRILATDGVVVSGAYHAGFYDALDLGWRNESAWDYGGYGDWEPTHWMPLPAPPERTP